MGKFKEEIVPSGLIRNALAVAEKKGRPMMKMMRDRADEFTCELEMKLTGYALEPETRALINKQLDREWSSNLYLANALFGEIKVDEVIIGAGFHAAVYAATRVRNGFPKPLVLEASERVGGAFAVSERPVFYLNSRNRPGNLGFPSDGQALNYIPGAPLQPAMLGMTEYQTNADIAMSIRLTLAQYANVLTNFPVESVERNVDPFGDYPSYPVIMRIGNPNPDSFIRNYIVRTKRVIDARGLGGPKLPKGVKPNGKTILTFPQFMARLGTPFPLQGIERAAVIGSGDSSRCAVEGLLGIGPQPYMASTGLDFVSRVDWYARGVADNCDSFRESERPRYQAIGKYLRRGLDSETRLRVFQERADATPILNSASVNERTYDIAIVCTGNERKQIEGWDSQYFDEITINGSYRNRVSDNSNSFIAKRSGSLPFYQVGPAANLPFSRKEIEEGLPSIPANSVAMFRLSNRTAALATNVDSFEED